MRDFLYDYIFEKYKIKSDQPWPLKFPNYEVFRHKNTRKWFALIMDIEFSKIDATRKGKVDIINLRAPDLFTKEMLCENEGFFQAYHMQNSCWFTIVLDSTLKKKKIFKLIDMSYEATR